MKLAWQSWLLLPVLLLPIVVTQAQTCSNSLAGYEASGVCCPVDCGTCGGSGCSQLGDGCCTKDVISSGVQCSSSRAAPCIIDGDISGPTSATSETCSNGIEGIDGNGVVCCPVGCGQCGGNGCGTSGAANGLDGDSCCGGGIKASGVMCSDSGSAPCIIDDEETSTPTETCSNGIEGIDGNGVVCCPLGCGQCGGTGCGSSGKANGLDGDSCCGGGIKDSGILCSDSGSAPCIIDEDSVSPTTPSPVDMSTQPTTPTPPTPSSPTPSYLITDPTPIMTTPSECSDGLPTFRYAASTGIVGKGRLYAESAGCFTMTDLYNFRGVEKDGSSKGPIYMLDEDGEKIVAPTSVTNRWLLEAELYVTNGAVLYCKGTDMGGDCNELRIRSNGPEDFYEVRGHGGSLYFESTIVTSWDTTTNSPQETYEGGRSFLNCVSEREHEGDACDGQAKNDMGECRMDLLDSEIGYLGWFDSESYGITWKVRGFCKDLSNHDVFTRTNVYGDIMGCDIHHNYYGHYSYGHQGGVWTDNKMHDNHQYGFDPHDDSDYLTIANNEVYNNFNHGIIASKRCNDVKIYNNNVYDGGPDAVGIFLHRSSDNAEVYNNKITNMKDAGIALLETMNADIHDNVIKGAEFGIRMSLGSAGNQVYDNSFDGCTEYGLYTYQGSDPPTVGVSDGRPNVNVFDGNTVSDTKIGVKLKNSDNTAVINNVFTGATEFEFYDAQSTFWSGNSLPSNACTDNVYSDDGNDVTESTFTSSSSGVPSAC
ncbi:unnamed protein product [Pylaiella littoralis]